MLGSNRRIKMRVDDDDNDGKNYQSIFFFNWTIDNLSEKSAKSVVWNETDLD
jgi:hypothetical protein